MLMIYLLVRDWKRRGFGLISALYILLIIAVIGCCVTYLVLMSTTAGQEFFFYKIVRSEFLGGGRR